MDAMTRHRQRGVLYAVLLASLLLRIDLVFAGGQFYWPDEDLYVESRQIVASLASGNVVAAFARLDKPEHWLFKVVGVFPATVERVAGPDSRIPAAFFSLFSVVNIWLLWAIARRAGAAEEEALLAATLAALSSSLFYYSRHLGPYDLAMTFGLLSLLVGLRRTGRDGSSFGCGILAGCAFLTYLGYWTLAAAALLIHVVHVSTTWSRAARHTLVSGLGLITPPGLIIVASLGFQGDFLQSLIQFSATVNQGEYAEGWRLPLEYLWHAEHLLLVLWCAGTAWCLWQARHGVVAPQVRAGLIGLCLIYSALAVLSVGLHEFVVYGRLARQLVPFFCLVTANGLTHLPMPAAARRAALIGTLACAIAQAGVNFSQPLRQVFPEEFRKAGEPLIAVRGPQCCVWINAKHIYPGPTPLRLAPHRVLMEAPHPLEFLPYQYEGYTPRERAVLRSSDISMRLVALSEPTGTRPRRSP